MMDVSARGAPAKIFTCTAYNDAVLLCNTQDLVTAEKFLAVALTVAKFLSPEDINIAKRVEQACALKLPHFIASLKVEICSLTSFSQTPSHFKT
jgi:hypothetical protein